MQAIAMRGQSMQAKGLLSSCKDGEDGENDAAVPDGLNKPGFGADFGPRACANQTDCCEGTLLPW